MYMIIVIYVKVLGDLALNDAFPGSTIFESLLFPADL